ncbi:MAG: carbon-nitrogen hydrolase family protein [Burkholderiales bacterium]|nr:carbon-nitrogen hydrolase family protein [Burkholderiales bacterium]
MPRIAIAQIPMHWELATNVQAMKQAMQLARAQGAGLCAFAELALTGFHRRIVEWAKPELVGPAVAEVQAAAASLGLTAPEATFFEPGVGRPVLRVSLSPGALACTAVICREVEDHDAVVAQLASSGVELILWPGQMRPDPAKPAQDPPAHVVQAQALARATGAWVVQTNWPNALNRPEESEHSGHSACIAPSGELLFRLPRQGFGVGVFSLAERSFDWCPVSFGSTATAGSPSP